MLRFKNNRSDAILITVLHTVGVWRSWLARAVWDREVGGSSPLTPTTIFMVKTFRIDERFLIL